MSKSVYRHKGMIKNAADVQLQLCVVILIRKCRLFLHKENGPSTQLCARPLLATEKIREPHKHSLGI